MKKHFLAIATLSILLSACGDDKPGEKLASTKIRQIAESEKLEGLEIADFVRDNGWIDDQTPNRYNARYKYNLKLIKPYQEVVLDNAKSYKAEIEDNAKKTGNYLFYTNAMQTSLATMHLSMTVDQWIGNQGKDFKLRLEKFLINCESCIDYWNAEDASNEQNLRRETYIASWMHFEELGFKDDAVVGSKVPRQAWAAFMKTEKGWLPVE